MISPAAVLVLVWAGPAAQASPVAALVIESDSSCPSAEAVREALAGLRPPADWPHTTVAISAREQFLLVALGSRGASPRQVTVGADCAARAATAAVIVATWLGDLPAESVGSPILQPSRSIDAAAAPPATPLPSENPTPPPALHEIGAGALAAFGGGTVPGLRVEFIRWRRERAFGWQASLALATPRDAVVGGGTTRWMRVAASVALCGRLAGRRYFLGGDGGVAAAYTAAWGQDYASNQSDQSITGGLAAGLRGGVPWGRMRIWTDVRVFGWLYPQSVQVDADGASGPAKFSLPAWDIQWALGASYAF
jgi:hypothetical protein